MRRAGVSRPVVSLRVVAPLLMFALLIVGCRSNPTAPWLELFDGRTLGGFTVTDFGGQGEVQVEHGRLELGIGNPLTGVTWTGPPPHGDYELELVARRDQGGDFFCGLTFPVGDAWLTLVLGGWGGSVCGLSSLDGRDASRNETRTLRSFATGRDYTVLVRVGHDRVDATVDGEPLCGVAIGAHQLGLRPEVLLCRPLGLASFATASSISRLRWRSLGSARE